MSQSDNTKWASRDILSVEPERMLRVEPSTGMQAEAKPEPMPGSRWDRLKGQFQDVLVGIAWTWIILTTAGALHFSYPYLHRSDFSKASDELRRQGLDDEAADLEEVGKVCRDDVNAPRACGLVYRHVRDEGGKGSESHTGKATQVATHQN